MTSEVQAQVQAQVQVQKVLPDEQAAYRQIDEHIHYLLVDISAARADRGVPHKCVAAEAALIFCAEILKQAIHEGHRQSKDSDSDSDSAVVPVQVPVPVPTYAKRRL